MMRLKNLQIGTQLRVGLGVIMVLVVLLGVLAWRQSNFMWEETQGIYDHPLQVRGAIGEIKTDVLSMSRGMKDLCLAGDEPERQVILQTIDTAEADAHQQFDILFDRYLGPRSDIDDVHQLFVQWKSIREETRRLLREGRTAEAVSWTRTGGAGDSHVDKLLGEIGHISKFTKSRAE